MRTLAARIRREPAVLAGAITSIALLFGHDVDPDTALQVASIAGPLVAGLVTRFFVTPVHGG